MHRCIHDQEQGVQTHAASTCLQALLTLCPCWLASSRLPCRVWNCISCSCCSRSGSCAGALSWLRRGSCWRRTWKHQVAPLVGCEVTSSQALPICTKADAEEQPSAAATFKLQAVVVADTGYGPCMAAGLCSPISGSYGCGWTPHLYQPHHSVAILLQLCVPGQRCYLLEAAMLQRLLQESPAAQDMDHGSMGSCLGGKWLSSSTTFHP